MTPHNITVWSSHLQPRSEYEMKEYDVREINLYKLLMYDTWEAVANMLNKNFQVGAVTHQLESYVWQLVFVCDMILLKRTYLY